MMAFQDTGASGVELYFMKAVSKTDHTMKALSVFSHKPRWIIVPILLYRQYRIIDGALEEKVCKH